VESNNSVKLFSIATDLNKCV